MIAERIHENLFFPKNNLYICTLKEKRNAPLIFLKFLPEFCDIKCMCLNPTYASSGTIRGACQWLGLSQVVTGLGLGLGLGYGYG